MGKMSVDTYLKIVFYSYMPSSGHFYFGLTDELRIRCIMLILEKLKIQVDNEHRDFLVLE